VDDGLNGFGGMAYEVATGYVEAKGSGEGRRTVRKVGGGAGLGAATGAAVASGGEEHLKLAAETRLQFQLSAAVNVRT
jgi:hypothetical protein